MQDIDDFDPLDDILLSDEELPESRTSAKYSQSFFQKSKEPDTDEESKKERKKKIIAELFGSNDEPPKTEEKPAVTTVPSKSDWLELKIDDTVDPSPSDSGDMQTNLKKVETIVESKIKDEDLKEKMVHLVNASGVSNRRKSDGKPTELQKMKHHFKSLDLDLFDLDSATDAEPTIKPEKSNESSQANNIEGGETAMKSSFGKTTLNETDTHESYTPSYGTSRRVGITKPKNVQSEQKDWLSSIVPEKSQKPTSHDIKETGTLPSWLEPKKENVLDSSSKSIAFDILRTKPDDSTNTIATSMRLRSTDGKIADQVSSEQQTAGKPERLASRVKIDTEEHLVSDALELKRKKDELEERVKMETESLTQQEQQIQSSAIELMLQQRDNIKTLFQIISFDPLFSDKKFQNSSRGDVSNDVEDFKNTVTSLQTKLTQAQFEKAELEMKLKHVERKHMINLTMLEDVYKYKLHMAEEKETYYKKEIHSLEVEHDLKIAKRKENEEELIKMYSDKIQLLKEDHINELKHAAELHSLKSPWRPTTNRNEPRNSEPLSDRELTFREIANEDKHKQLLELEAHLNSQKFALDGKESSFQARTEEYDVKMMKEKLQLDQQRKELKLSQNILEEKQNQWQREQQREKEHLANCKQELELAKEDLLAQERKLTKEKFEIYSERARLEAVVNAEVGSGGDVKDIIQSRAELQGTVNELQRLKSKLESERNEVRKEEMRLKEEGWKLRVVEQQLMLQQKQFQKLLEESERKRDEGLQALKKAQNIEGQINERVEEVERRVSEVNRKEERLIQEKMELSKERDILAKKKYQLDMILPQLTLEEQLPFTLLNKNILDPRIMMMKLKAESILDE